MAADGGLTHVDEHGAARMVDVGDKPVTARTASATGRVLVSRTVVDLLRGEGVPKGDALAVARIAGIMGAKQTPALVPLCHPLSISGVTVDLVVTDESVDITATVRTTDRTGVEMEALTAVSVAALTVVDMVKAVDKAAVITDIQVETKTGGRSGDWTAMRGSDEGAAMSLRAAVVVASNRAAAGVYADETGPLLADWLRGQGFDCAEPAVVPDGDPVGAAISAAVDAGARVVLTTGGTGLTPTDRTPEATRPLLDREVPGIAEAIRAAGVAKDVPTAMLSRGLAGIAGDCLVINLPGSRGGVKDGLGVLEPVLRHAVEQVVGSDH